MSSAYDNFIKLAMKEPAQTPAAFLAVKKRIAKITGLPLPTNADIREIYNDLVDSGIVKKNDNFEKILISKKSRTQSGVAVVAVLTKPYPCPGKCLYCPDEKAMPKSYLSNEPAVMRAIAAKFDPYVQVRNRIKALELNGHKADKIELIVMGGTFSYFPKKYQRWFVTRCFQACNNHSSSRRRDAVNRVSTLADAQKINETAKHRVIGLTLETRPDYIDQKEIINFRKLGCTRVELGVQSIFDDVLKINKRGHNVQKTIEATKLLKNAGFKINYHIMPGLPGSNLKKDYQMFQELFSNPDFQPDMLKIYPTVVIKNSELYNVWEKGKYKALTDKAFEKFIIEVKKNLIPPYVRIARLVRDVPETSIVAGPKISNLRQIISHKVACPCIRCREVRADYKIKEKIILDRIDYDASGGHEIFLQYVSPDKKKLFALLRLRINGGSTSIMEVEPPRVLKNTAIIREIHTYGQMTEIDKSNKKSPQHIGLGKKLIIEAERIARQEFGLKKIVVISGVGVRGYYRKLGYRLKDTYMVKSI